MSNGFVVLMGLATVFIGIICIIVVCMIMSALVRTFDKTKADSKSGTTSEAANAVSANSSIADRNNIVVAISAAIAEEIGEDAGAIRILSLRKI